MSSLIDSEDIPNFLLDKATSKPLRKMARGFVVSPEVFDLLNKLLKSDDENATGDAQLLCELFSGERVSYRYASEKTRQIGCNVPFSIVGATQVPFAARLIARMDQGHGLLDRFLFIFPTCLRPSLQTHRMLCHGWKANRLVTDRRLSRDVRVSWPAESSLQIY